MPPRKPEKDKSKITTAADKLRTKAAERLLYADKAGLETPLPEGESQRLRYELEINHIELEIQNDELVRARDETDIALDKFTDLFESGPVGFLTLTRDGSVKAISLSSAGLLGINRSQLLGKRFGLFVTNESRHAFADLLDKTFTNSSKVVCDVALQPEGSSPVYVQLAAKVAASGQECNVALIDITQRKHAEEALSLSELRYRAVVEDQTELIFRYRPDGSYSFVNEVFRRFFGKTDEEIIGQGWHHDVVAEDIPMVEERLRLLCPEYPVVVIENRVISGSGEIYWMQFVNRGFFDEKGRLIETQSVGRDTTERKQAEELVRIYTEEVQDLYNNAPCGYHSLDENGTIVRINDTELRWLGYQREEVLGILNFTDIIAAESVEAFRVNFPQFREQGWVSNLTFEMLRKDRSKFPVIVNAEAIRDNIGRYLMSRSMVFDNTMNKKSEEILKKYARRLIVLEEDLRKKIAGDLHDDVAQDLIAIGFNLTHVSNHLKDESRDSLQGILEDSRNLAKVVSRSVRNLMIELHPQVLEEFGLETALRSYVEQFAKRTGLDAVFNTDANFPRLTAKKETALFRITQEALQNILKHATATNVTIVLSNSGGVVRLTVTDDGKGFVPKAASPLPTGSGWGLTNMRERAELIGGSFRVHSVVGKGTTIAVEFKGARCPSGNS